MAATNTTALPTQVALLYVAALPASGITALNSTGSNAATVATSVETAVSSNWKRLSSLQWVKKSRDITKWRSEIITDDNDLIWLSTIEDISIDATWFESHDPNAIWVLTGITPVLATWTYSAGAVIKPRQLPRLVAKIVTVADGNGKIDTYYLIDSSVDWTLLQNFLKYDGNFEGAPIKLKLNRGGTYIESIQTYT